MFSGACNQRDPVDRKTCKEITIPKGKSGTDSRASDLKKMSGTDFAMEVTKDMVLLPKDERGKAIRMLTALNETINRETEALAAR